jgi:FAD/FMN-containing dehydrogenase
MKDELTAIFGTVREDVEEFRGDPTENEPRTPAFVVRATEEEQVGRLLELASRRKIPVTPRVAGMNIGGLAIPAEGGIVLDLRALDRVAVDAEHGVAEIGPGVTWEQLKEEAAQHGLSLGFPLSPPDTSVLAGALLDGLGTRSLVHGSYADWLTGVIAYLADGTRITTGSAALSGRFLSRGPLPDLTGLFVSWFGTTGIVVRGGFLLWPERACRRRDVVPCRDVEEGVRLMLRGAPTGLFDDLGGLGWPAGKWALGVDDLGPRDPEEPELYVVADYAADTPRELRRKRAALEEISPAPPVAVADLLRLSPELAPFAELPVRLSFLLDHEGGGLSWVGTYGPLHGLAEAARAGIRLLEERGLPPLVVTRPMKGGHYAILRFIERFDRRDEAETARIRDTNLALGRELMDRGYVPYKCPEGLVGELFERLDPGFRTAMERIRAAFDPEGILNPDRWRAPGGER